MPGVGRLLPGVERLKNLMPGVGCLMLSVSRRLKVQAEVRWIFTISGIKPSCPVSGALFDGCTDAFPLGI